MADPFDDLVAGLEFDESDAIDYTTLPLTELLKLKANLEEELKALREVRYPRTDRGREIHSELTAVYTAIKRRR